MSEQDVDQDGFDARLAACFEQEHRQVPADAFVAATMQEVRAKGRRSDLMRVIWRVAALLAIVAASPWLIAGVARVNALLSSSLSWTTGQPVACVLGVAVAIVVVVAGNRLRGR